ncbi:MAG: hypothetical protein AABW64_01940 [Nanoarchaeota archaeon]
MNISPEHIEKITSEKLRKLPTHYALEYFDDGIYDADNIIELEESDAISLEECGFMVGYLNEEG